MKRLGCRLPTSGRGSRRRRNAPTLLLIVLAAAAPGAAGTARARPAVRQAPVTDSAGATVPNADVVTIGHAPVSRPIPPGFVCVSLEYKTILSTERLGTGGTDPVLAQLIRNLAPGEAPVVRIGGDSTDWTWWPVRGLRRPPGVSFGLSPAWVARARALAVSAGARLILGINLETDNPAIASTEARHMVDGIGRRHIAALEIGNEPELYSALPWYHTRAGAKVFGRPPSYDLAAYGAELARIAKVLPAVPLAGPSTGSSTWISGLGQLVATDPRLRMATFHAYALDPFGDAFRGHNCSTARADPAHPTVAALLAAFASQGLLRDVSPSVALAHLHGLSFRLDEMNAVTCAGTAGVSNTSASALWVLDALFVLAEAGVDGVNIHTWRGSAGKLFDLHYRRGRWVASLRPEYYGLLAFARAVPPGSRLIDVAQLNPGRVRAWAVRGPRGEERVVLINDDLHHGRLVIVRPPGAAGRARLERLEAPSAYARRGLTLGGQSFGRRTTTGLLAGSPQVIELHPGAGGYAVRVPAASAAILTLAD